MADAWERIEAADRRAHRLMRDFAANDRTRRTTEATPQQRAASGASVGGAGLVDPIDGSYGYRQVGRGRGPRDIPERTRQTAVTDSIASYRVNPMARAMIDTYVAFCVGDSGLTLQSSSDLVRPIVRQAWDDPRNAMVLGQELMFKDWLLHGEQLQQMMVGAYSGVCRRCPTDVSRIVDVTLAHGNPLWPEHVLVRMPDQDEPTALSVIGLDDISGLRQGDAFFWPAFKTLETDTRGAPFLMPVLDWLDSYDSVLSNLIDRTALARYMVMDVTLKDSDPNAVENFVKQRGSRQVPRSGTVEVHNDQVEWKTMSAQTGAFEDMKTNASILTLIAAGSGLSKTYLAEPEDANRATSITMAEPVRRRIGSVQNQHIANVTEMARFWVDRAVEAGRLPAMVPVRGEGDTTLMMPAALTVTVTGPQVAQADAQVAAEVLVALGTGLTEMVAAGVMTKEAAVFAAKKGWTDYVGIPYAPELDSPDRKDDLAEYVEEQNGRVPLAAV